MNVDLLIDGYNLLHAAGLAKQRYAPGDLQRRRARLLQKLAELLDPAVQKRTTVVFDARRSPPEHSPPEPERLIQVIFTPVALEADDVIEEMLARHSSPKQVVVVSSDRRLRRAAKRRGAGSLTSEVFLDQIEGSSSASEPRRAEPRRSPEISEELAQAMREAAEEELRQIQEDQPIREADRKADTPKPSASLDPLDDPEFWQRRLKDHDP